GGSETILVAEDEDAIRRLARDVLTARGYTVLTAADGAQALEAARRHDGAIHLLLTDVVMKGMSGRDLARRLTLSRPHAKVFYLSGTTDDAIVPHGVLNRGTNFLQKPFASDALAWKVRDVLDKPRASSGEWAAVEGEESGAKPTA